MVPTRLVLTALLFAALAGCTCGGSPVNLPDIVSFTCSPSPVPYPGGSVTLSWNVTGAISLSIDNGVGVVNPPTSGSTVVTVTTTTTFTLTATGPSGSTTKACPVPVEGPGPHINSFTATPSVLPTTGGLVMLAWDVTGATEVRVYPDGGLLLPPDAGTTTVGVTATTEFVLVAANAIGQNTADAGVVVPPSNTVAGAVVDQTGQPGAGLTVLISSGTFSQSAATDADGGFTINKVPQLSYNATVITPESRRRIRRSHAAGSDATEHLCRGH